MPENIARQPAVADSQAGETQTPIDMDHLGRQALGDYGLQLEILRLYAEMSKVYFSRIESSSSDEELARSLHTLRSAASGIGAWAVRELTRQAEEELRDGHFNPGRIADIAQAVNECSAYIEELLDDEAD